MQFLYIDPGTGSMLFSILIGVVSTLFFFGQRLFMKLKFIFNGGKTVKINNSKIQYVIFSDHKRYWNVFKPICDEFEKRGINISYWTASPDDPGLKEQYKHVNAEFIGEGNKAFSRLNMMNAHICLSTTPGLDVYQWKRSKNVDKYVHIVHMANDASEYRMFGLDYYDSVLCSGNNQVEQIRKLENIRSLSHKDIAVVGCTYMDSLLTKRNELKSSERVKNQKTILLAPSWGKSAILSKYGNKIINSLISTGYKIVIRPHPQSFTAEAEMLKNMMSKYPSNANLEWNRDNDNFKVLSEADILITDFSGVIFDYALIFERPVIYADTKFDYSPYDAAWLDEPLWTFKVLPKIGVKLEEENISDIKKLIDSTISNPDFKKNLEEIRLECWENPGNSAKETVDYLTKLI